MTLSPPIELNWGGKKEWPDSHIKHAKSTIETALKLADEVLLEIGIDYEDPKTATVISTNRPSSIYGEAHSSFDFSIYVNRSDILRKRIASQLYQLFITSTHEMLHCVRYEDEDCGTLNVLDCSAHEGLAYVGEYLAAELILKEELDSLGSFLENPFIIYEKHHDEEEILLELALSDSSSSDTDEAHRKWFDSSEGNNFSQGVKLGILAVGRLLDSQRSLGQIIKMPAKKIFDLE